MGRRLIVALLPVLLPAGCGDASKSGTSPTSPTSPVVETPAQACSSAATYSGLNQAIADAISPASLVGRTSVIQPRKIVEEASLARPFVEKVDRETGRISCSVDIRYPQLGIAARLLPVPAGLKVETIDDQLSVRVAFDIMPQADTGTRNVRVGDAEKVAEFEINAWGLLHSRELDAAEKREEARDSPGAADAGQPAATPAVNAGDTAAAVNASDASEARQPDKGDHP